MTLNHSIKIFLDLVKDLSLALSGFEVLVALCGLFQREAGVYADVELPVLQPTEDLVGAFNEFCPGRSVIKELGTSDVRRLSDETEDGEGRDGTGGVAKGDEDSPVGKAADGDINGRLSNAVNDGFASLAICDFHYLRYDIHRFVVLVGGTRNLVEHEKFVASERLANVLLALGNGTNDLV